MGPHTLEQSIKLVSTIHKAQKILKSIEWSGSTRGPSTGMGLDNGEEWDCCPKCGGVKPSCLKGWNESFQHLAGHKKRCSLAKFIKDAKNI
jgi:hypothetical protein